MEATNPKLLFKDWVPEWLVKLILFSALMPNMVLFFLPMANIEASAGSLGCEPKDIQFAVMLFYAGFVGFYSLERRFFTFLATKEYFIIFTVLQMFTSFILYNTTQLNIIFPIRFMQGIFFASSVNLSISTIFTRLSSDNARELSFSFFFGLLLCTTPFNTIVTVDLIDNFDYFLLYKVAVFSFVPALLMILLSMNYIRLQTKFPLYKLDWQSFVLYSTLLILFGYIMVYGQQYYWFEDFTIRLAFFAMLGFLFFFVKRQYSLKRPYLDFKILNFRNFKIGCLVLFIMYICRFASGITNTYFASVLKFDPHHIAYFNLYNLLGILSGVAFACLLLFKKVNIRFIWGTGFSFLLIFHIAMYFLFNVAVNESYFFAPLFMQGAGVGLIMVPTIIYALASVDLKLGPSAAAFCLAVRYLGFAVSTGLVNFFSLYRKQQHHNRFQDNITATNHTVSNEIAHYSNKLSTKGMLESMTDKAANQLLLSDVDKQASLRYAMDYYEMMAWIILSMIILVVCTPYINKTMVYLKSKTLAPT